MPRISEEKEKKIKESILYVLFQQTPKLLFTADVAKELARDEEFIKKLLLDLETRKFVISSKKNSLGQDYTRRIRWRLSNQAYQAYNAVQPANIPNHFA